MQPDLVVVEPRKQAVPAVCRPHPAPADGVGIQKPPGAAEAQPAEIGRGVSRREVKWSTRLPGLARASAESDSSRKRIPDRRSTSRTISKVPIESIPRPPAPSGVSGWIFPSNRGALLRRMSKTRDSMASRVMVISWKRSAGIPDGKIPASNTNESTPARDQSPGRSTPLAAEFVARN